MAARSSSEDFQGHIDELTEQLARVLAAQEDERRALVATLQEQIGQPLTALSLNLRVLEQHSSDARSAELVSVTRKLAGDALRALDALQRSLYPAALVSQGIVPAFEVYIQEFAHANDIQVLLDAELPPRRFAPELEIGLFRILQDALAHFKQARGTGQIKIHLCFIKERAYLVIENDGPSGVAGGRTTLIEERARALGGTCAMRLLAYGGTCLDVVLPLAEMGQP
jgi:signal transduction histidine kinase